MLRELAIKNFAIINDIRIPFSSGLSVLTGETGAGKSIIIEAVNLLLGGRGSADLVRSGQDAAELEAIFDIPMMSTAAGALRDAGFDPEDGLIIRRIIAANGKHRLYINDRQATLALLKSVTENLAGISSQHAHQGLLDEANHLDILDRFAGTWPIREQVATRYRGLTATVKELDRLTAEQETLSRELEFVRFQIEEIEKASLIPGEDVQLEEEYLRLKNGWELNETVLRAVDDLYSKEGSVVETLGTLKDDLEKKGRIDPVLKAAADRAERAMLELEDLAHELRAHGDTIELSPEALDEAEVRMDQIKKLKRKYGGSLESLFEHYHGLKQTLEGVETGEKQIDTLQIRAGKTSKELKALCRELSEKRIAAAEELGRRSETELKGLEMDNVVFSVAVSPIDDVGSDRLFVEQGARITATGMDRAAFLMAPNPGEPPRALSRIASGGELSRVVLALKAVLTETESVGTLIFDEVDSGIGGKTSDKVGKKLKKLADTHQVICITHLAQIAKYGASHYRIAKAVENNRTSTTITLLETSEKRVHEIARMIGGETITSATLDHAAELLGISGA